MNSVIEIKCEFCGQRFQKELRYYKRNQKLNRKDFCSRSCASKFNIFKNPGLPLNVKPGKELDKFSPFRKHYYSAKTRSVSKDIEFSITLQDLLDQWDRQNGKCALSGLKINLPKNSGESLKHPFMASLDRIFPIHGYIPSNIQWVCLIGQFAKNEFSQDDLYIFCHEFCEHQNKELN